MPLSDRRPLLVQVANVGDILGGTAACAWTISRALSNWDQHVLFLSPPTPATRRAFGSTPLEHCSQSPRERMAELRPDWVILHNTPTGRGFDALPWPTFQYLHSAISPAAADQTRCCSHWLASQFKSASIPVLWQAVPRALQQPATPQRFSPLATDRFIVGRICTPQPHKWPPDTVTLYATLATHFPQIDWQFVGCPDQLRPALTHACRGRAQFFPASWSARSRCWTWHALLYSNPHLTESFGRTVAEAMRTGCVPIVDRRGGFIEQLPSDTGYLCESTTDFRNALTDLMQSANWHARAAACHRWAESQFSLARFAQDLSQLSPLNIRKTAPSSPPSPDLSPVEMSSN